jgi:hypothetical protein
MDRRGVGVRKPMFEADWEDTSAWCVGSVPRSRLGQRIGAPVNVLKSGWAGDDHGAVGAKFGRI